MPSSIQLIVGTNKGAFLYRADAARKNWTMTGPHLPGWDVYSAHRDAGGRIHLGTSHYVYGATFRTTDDDGGTWAQQEGRPAYPAETGWPLKRIWQIVGHPTEAETLFCGVEEAGLFVSRDRGQSWHELSSLTRQPNRDKWFAGGGGLCLHTILINPNDPREMWIGISSVGLFHTTDRGETWINRNATLPKLATGSDDVSTACCVHKVALDPKDPHHLFMQFHGGVLESTDAGDHWRKIESGLPSNFGFPIVITRRGELFVVPLVADVQRYFADESMTVYRSKDSGRSWQALRNGLPKEPSYTGVLRDAMAVDQLESPGVYVGTMAGEVFASPDAGESWMRLPGQLPRINCVRAYAIE